MPYPSPVRVNVVHRDRVPGTPRDFDAAMLSTVQDMVAAVLSGLHFENHVRNRKVLIKPNLVRPNPDFPPTTTTDPRVIIALLRLCRDAGADSIGLGDKPGIGLSCRGGEKLLGLGEFLREVGAHFVYFDESEEVWEDNPEGELEPALPIPKVLRDYDTLIDLAKLKLHMHTGVSLGIKNLFGLVPEHFRLKHHREDLHRFLVDYLYRVNPTITLIDGIWGLEGQAPICGIPVKDFNTLIASENIVAADSIGAHLMGVNPEEITMIRMAADAGFGPCKLAEIDTGDADLDSIRRHFTRPVLSAQNVYPGVNVMVRGGCVGCLSSLRHALDRLHLAEKLQETPQTILLGFHHEAEEIRLPNDPGQIWCYGDCTAETFTKYFHQNPNAHQVVGCPPHFMDFYRAYCLTMGLDPD